MVVRETSASNSCSFVLMKNGSKFLYNTTEKMHQKSLCTLRTLLQKTFNLLLLYTDKVITIKFDTALHKGAKLQIFVQCHKIPFIKTFRLRKR